jgi:hypothetical protein
VVIVPDENQSPTRWGRDPSERAVERTSYLPRILARRPVAPDPAESTLRAHSGELPQDSRRGARSDVESTLAPGLPDPETAAVTAVTGELPVVDADGHGDEPGRTVQAAPEGPDMPLLTHGPETVTGSTPATGEHAAHATAGAAQTGAARPDRASRAGRRGRGTAVLVLAVVVLAVAAGVAYWLTGRGSNARPGGSQHEVAAGTAGGPDAADRGGPRDGSAPATETVGAFAFTKHHGPVRARNCAEHSYGRTHRFFTHTPCRWVSRTLYESSTPKGAVVSSVSVVRMPSAAQAAALKRITDTDGSGNVTDLVSDGINVPGGPDKIRGRGYASEIHGSTVTIVESGPVDGDPDNAYLKRVSTDAARVVS